MAQYVSRFRATALQQLDRLLTLSWSSLLLWLLLAVLAVTRLLFIDQFSVGGGELYAFIAAQSSWSGLFALAVADIVHPPLFYILLKLWIGLGGTALVWVKLFAVLCGAAIVVPFLLLCQTLRLRPGVRNLALLFLVANGYLTHYAQELRMYGLFATLALFSLWLFLKFWTGPASPNRDLVALFFVNLVMVYTHYYGWLVVGIEFMLLVLWQRQKLALFGLSALLLALAFAPWVRLVYLEATRIGGLGRNLDWIPRPGLTRLASLYIDFIGSSGSQLFNGLALVAFTAPVALLAASQVRPAWRALRRSHARYLDASLLFWSLFAVAYLPSLFLFVLSQRTVVALWIDRYFVFAAAPHMLLVALGLAHLRPAHLRWGAVALVVLWSLGAGARDGLTNRMAWQGSQLGTRIPWEALAEQLSRAEPEQQASLVVYTLPVYSEGLLTGDWVVSTSLAYYLDALHDDRFQFVYASDSSHMLSKVQEQHFWVSFIDLGRGDFGSPVKALTRNGYRVGQPIVDQYGSKRLVLLPVWHD